MFIGCLAAALAGVTPLAHADPPPLLPDWEAAQLYEGCAVQADGYARRLKALDPAWDVSLAALTLPSGLKHSVAVIRRGDERYLRDSILGVFAAGPDLQVAFDRRLHEWRNQHPYSTPNARNNYHPPSSETATAAVADIVQRSLQTTTRQYLVAEGRERFWVVTWTTIDGQCALYHPRIGTTLTRPRGSADQMALAILRAIGCRQPALVGSSQR